MKSLAQRKNNNGRCYCWFPQNAVITAGKTPVITHCKMLKITLIINEGLNKEIFVSVNTNTVCSIFQIFSMLLPFALFSLPHHSNN